MLMLPKLQDHFLRPMRWIPGLLEEENISISINMPPPYKYCTQYGTEPTPEMEENTPESAGICTASPCRDSDSVQL